MRLIKNTTELIGIKDQNIKISLVFETDTHIEIQAKLDYPEPSSPHYQGKANLLLWRETPIQKYVKSLFYLIIYRWSHQKLKPYNLLLQLLF